MAETTVLFQHVRHAVIFNPMLKFLMSNNIFKTYQPNLLGNIFNNSLALRWKSSEWLTANRVILTTVLLNTNTIKFTFMNVERRLKYWFSALLLAPLLCSSLPSSMGSGCLITTKFTRTSLAWSCTTTK